MSTFVEKKECIYDRKRVKGGKQGKIHFEVITK